MNLKIEYLPAAQLIPYARNMNKHSDEHVAEIVASIKEFGWTFPILIDKENVIVAGHGRLLAAQRLGLESVPTIKRDHWTEAQIKAMRIADNRIPKNAEIDTPMLSLDLGELDAAGFDLDLLGFGAEELEALLNPEVAPADGLTDPDAIPEVKETRCKPGDLWILGNHRLLCGDATNPQHVDRLMIGVQADMLFTDPPYGIGYEYASHDDSDAEANAQLVADVFALHDCGKAWTPGLMNLGRDLSRFGKTKVAVWYKKFAMAGNGIGGASTWEPILITNPQVKGLKNDVIEVKTDREEVGGVSLRELHSCPKPVALYETLMTSLSEPKANIREPFCGSGTTLIASERTGRRCFATEIDPKYCDVILTRWEQFTGKQATLMEA